MSLDADNLREQAFDLMGMPLFMSDAWDNLSSAEKAHREQLIERLFNKAGEIDQQNGCWDCD